MDKIDKLRVPIVEIDENLSNYRNKVLFPAKLAKTNNMLKSVILPPFITKS